MSRPLPRRARRGAVGVALAERRWEADAACAGASDDDGHQGRARKALCAVCPVLVPCLVDDLSRGGVEARVAGGAGGSRRRLLARDFWACGHDPLTMCADPLCGWCTTLSDHVDRLDAGHLCSGAGFAPLPVFGPFATHGLRSTSARGCRCPPCRFSASAAGVRLTEAGFDTATFWAQHSPGLDPDDWPSTMRLLGAVVDRHLEGSVAA